MQKKYWAQIKFGIKRYSTKVPLFFSPFLRTFTTNLIYIKQTNTLTVAANKLAFKPTAPTKQVKLLYFVSSQYFGVSVFRSP